MTTESAASSPALTRDVPCITCGYNLRGLNASGLCPECSTPIATSLSEQSGRVSTTKVIWARCMIVGLIGWVLITAFGVLLQSYVWIGGHDRYPGPQLWTTELGRPSTQVESVLTHPMAYSVRMWAVACLVMIYLITSPGIHVVPEVAFSWRRIARWFALAMGGLMIVQFRTYADWGLPREMNPIIALVGTTLLYAYLAQVARDIGLGTEGKAMLIAAAIAGVTMGLSMLWPYVTTVLPPGPFGGTGIGQWISDTTAGRRVDSICSTVGLIGGVIAAGTMIRIALAILPMARQRMPT